MNVYIIVHGLYEGNSFSNKGILSYMFLGNNKQSFSIEFKIDCDIMKLSSGHNVTIRDVFSPGEGSASRWIPSLTYRKSLFQSWYML